MHHQTHTQTHTRTHTHTCTQRNKKNKTLCKVELFSRTLTDLPRQELYPSQIE